MSKFDKLYESILEKTDIYKDVRAIVNGDGGGGKIKEFKDLIKSGDIEFNESSNLIIAPLKYKKLIRTLYATLFKGYGSSVVEGSKSIVIIPMGYEPTKSQATKWGLDKK